MYQLGEQYITITILVQIAFSLHWWKVRGFFDFWIVLGGAWTSSWLQQLDRGGLWKTLCVEMHLQTKFLFYFSLISLSSSLFWLLTPISFQIIGFATFRLFWFLICG